MNEPKLGNSEAGLTVRQVESDLARESAFTVDSIGSFGPENQALNDVVYKKSFDSIENLRNALEKIGYHIEGLPFMLKNSSDNHAAVSVSNGESKATLTIVTKESLRQPNLKLGE